MDASKMHDESDDLELEDMKVEPAGQCCHENVNGFAGFDNSGTIPSTADAGALNFWTPKATTCLITQYKKYRSMVGQSTKIRSLREMFEKISLEMQKFGFDFSPQKCENKWKVLERKYKNLVFRERLKNPGRVRHYGHWEHKRALDEIFHEKKRHVYLEENGYSPPNTSNKFIAISSQATAENSNSTASLNQTPEETLTGAKAGPQNARKTDDQFGELKGTLAAMFEKFLIKMDKNFAIEQQNKEKRHREKMLMRQRELDLQKKLFELKELKMQLRKSQLIAAAQHLHLNIQ